MDRIGAIVVLAQEEGGLQLWPGAPEVIWGGVAFTVLMALLGYLVFPRLNQALDERTARVQGQIEDAEAERNRVVQDLRNQVAALSVDLAGRIVERELDEERHRDLVDSYIDNLSSVR